MPPYEDNFGPFNSLLFMLLLICILRYQEAWLGAAGDGIMGEYEIYGLKHVEMMALCNKMGTRSCIGRDVRDQRDVHYSQSLLCNIIIEAIKPTRAYGKDCAILYNCFFVCLKTQVASPLAGYTLPFFNSQVSKHQVALTQPTLTHPAFYLSIVRSSTFRRPSSAASMGKKCFSDLMCSSSVRWEVKLLPAVLKPRRLSMRSMMQT